MSHGNWDCTECHGGGWRGNADDELVSCNVPPADDTGGVVMGEIHDESAMSPAVAALYAAVESPILAEMPLADEHVTMTAPIPSERSERTTVETLIPLDLLLLRRLVSVGGGQ